MGANGVMDNYERAALVLTALTVIALMARNRWITERDEARDGDAIALTLVAVSVVVVAAVILAGAFGAHPA
ncbi:MAG: hypothetical protein ACREML_14050 [Vulcanimicrobiaceae bacterium]